MGLQYLTIDGIKVKLEGENNLLELIRKAKIDLPTFCYHSELSVYGACRLCIVDVKGRGIMGACSTLPEANIEVRTQTPELKKVRKTTIELLLASGEHQCSTCQKSQDCKLRMIAHKLGVTDIRFKAPNQLHAIDDSSKGITRDQNKCVLCGDCVRACSEIQNIGAIDFIGRGPTTSISPAYKAPLAHVDCVDCGQCVRVCPTGALMVKSDIENVMAAIYDNTKKVVVQVAPACRIAIGELFDRHAGADMTGQMVTALKMIGFDQVYDTAFTADLTVLEEAKEFLQRVQTGTSLPIMTSCCPAWVKFAEQSFPDLLANISTCRSPQQMFGSVAKEYLPKNLGIDAKDLVVVSIMPCTAKKYEASREEFSKDGIRDVDFVLTTQELAAMVQQNGIMFTKLQATPFDLPFGIKTGAGIIFGNSGGVSEAVLRYVARSFNQKEEDTFNIDEVQSSEGRRVVSFKAGENTFTLCIVYGLKNAREVAEDIRAKRVHYDIVEIMSCPGGCIGGAGQPTTFKDETRQQRTEGLRHIDRHMELRVSCDNTHIDSVKMKSFSTAKQTHDLLHTRYCAKKRIQLESISLTKSNADDKVTVKVCVGTSCYLKGSIDILHRILRKAKEGEWSDKVEISAGFCAEKCNKGPTVHIGDRTLFKTNIDEVVKEIDLAAQS